MEVKFGQHQLAKDLTVGMKGLKLVIVRQKRQSLGLVYAYDGVDGVRLRSRKTLVNTTSYSWNHKLKYQMFPF